LKELYCYENKIIELENLPESLKELNCSYNPFTLDYDYEINITTIQKYNSDKMQLIPVLK